MKTVIEKLKNAKSVAILTHIVEDGDCIGSALALKKVLEGMGKAAIVYVSAKVEERLDFLGNDYIIYSPERLSEHDLCVCVDCADVKRLGERAEILEKIPATVNIDHHYTNTMYADVNYVEGDASSTGEVIYKFIKEMGVEPDSQIAAYLYAAICSDTGSFKFSNTSPQTMRIAADLLEYDIKHDEIARRLFDTFTLDEIHLKAELMAGVESYCDGKVSLVAFEEELIAKYGIAEENIPSVVDIPRSVEGTEIAVALKRINGEVRANLRSNSDVNVAEIAAQFGGGGHVKAAGFRVKNAEIDDVRKRVIEFAKKALEKTL